MALVDGQMSFDLQGNYTAVVPLEHLAYTVNDGRKVAVDFLTEGGGTRFRESFDAETLHSRELLQQGWGAILENFRKYAAAV